jgi:hypothetical protein
VNEPHLRFLMQVGQQGMGDLRGPSLPSCREAPAPQ